MPESLPFRAKHRAAERLGRQAEDEVASWLQRKGYEILGRRFKTGVGELDLVVATARRLVFVEVKARSNFIDAAYAMLPRQQARLLRAAHVVLAQHPSWMRPEIRFDVALVASGEISIIENAIWFS